MIFKLFYDDFLHFHRTIFRFRAYDVDTLDEILDTLAINGVVFATDDILVASERTDAKWMVVGHHEQVVEAEHILTCAVVVAEDEVDRLSGIAVEVNHLMEGIG